MIKMTLSEIMKIRHGGDSFHNGGIWLKGNKFYKVSHPLGTDWFGRDKGKKLPVEEWEEIEVIETTT